MTGTSSALADLTRVEAILVQLLELLAEPESDEARLREAWRACERDFAVLPAGQDLGRLARGEPLLAERLRSVVRLNGLVLEGAHRQGAVAAKALGVLRAQREGLALMRRDGSGGSCDVTG